MSSRAIVGASCLLNNASGAAALGQERGALSHLGPTHRPEVQLFFFCVERFLVDLPAAGVFPGQWIGTITTMTHAPPYINQDEVHRRLGALGDAISPHEVGILLSGLGAPAPAGPTRQQQGAAASLTARTRKHTDEDFALLSARLDDLEALLGKLGTPKPAHRPQRPPPAVSSRAAADPGPLPNEQHVQCACGACLSQRGFRRDEVPQLRAYAAGVWPAPCYHAGGTCGTCAGTSCCKGGSSNKGGGTTELLPERRAVVPTRLAKGRIKLRSDPVARYQ
jgi:hypothetical protein